MNRGYMGEETLRITYTIEQAHGKHHLVIAFYAAFYAFNGAGLLLDDWGFLDDEHVVQTVRLFVQVQE